MFYIFVDCVFNFLNVCCKIVNLFFVNILNVFVNVLVCLGKIFVIWFWFFLVK